VIAPRGDAASVLAFAHGQKDAFDKLGMRHVTLEFVMRWERDRFQFKWLGLSAADWARLCGTCSNLESRRRGGGEGLLHARAGSDYRIAATDPRA